MATFTRDKRLYLTCQETLFVPKEYNIRRHFEAKHPDMANLNESVRQIKESKF